MPKPCGFKAKRNHRNHAETGLKPPETMLKPSSFPWPETTETSAYKHWFGFGWVRLSSDGVCNRVLSIFGKLGGLAHFPQHKRNAAFRTNAAKRLSPLGNRANRDVTTLRPQSINLRIYMCSQPQNHCKQASLFVYVAEALRSGKRPGSIEVQAKRDEGRNS
jgi:hypothetical protein